MINFLDPCQYMNRIILCLIMLFTFLQGNSQNYLISNPNLNDLWVEIDNPIIITVENMACDSIFLTIDNGTINFERNDKNYKCFYVARPKEKGRAVIQIKKIVNGDTITIGSENYRVRNNPRVFARIGTFGEVESEIKKTTLAAQLGIYATLDYPNFPFSGEARFEILHYSIIFSRNNECIYSEEKCIGPFFTKEFKDILKTLEENDIVLFHGINVEGPDGQIRNIAPMELKVKN